MSIYESIFIRNSPLQRPKYHTTLLRKSRNEYQTKRVWLIKKRKEILATILCVDDYILLLTSACPYFGANTYTLVSQN